MDLPGVQSALQIGLLGMQKASHAVDRHAAEIAGLPAQTQRSVAGDLAGPLVGLLVARAQFEASASVVRRVDEMLTSLLGAVGE
jgi:hypothetical protein